MVTLRIIIEKGKMKLKEYIQENGLKMSFLCKKLKLTRQTLYRACLGQPMSPEVARIIKENLSQEIEIAISSSCGNHVRNRKKENLLNL